MAAEAPPTDQATSLPQDLSLDSEVKAEDAPQVTKKPSSGGALPRAPIRPYERSVTPVLQEYMDQNMCYVSIGYPSSTYYYGGYDGLLNDGAEMPSPGVYGFGYAPYGPYFPAPYYQPPAFNSAPYIPNQAASLPGEVSTSAATGQPPVPVATTISNGVDSGNRHEKNGLTLKKNRRNLSPSSSSYTKGVLAGGPPPSCCVDLRFGFGGNQLPAPWSNGPMFADRQQRLTTTNSVSSTISHTKNNTHSRNQNLCPLPNFTNLLTPRLAPGNGPTVQENLNRLYPNNQIYGQGGNCPTSGLGLGSYIYDSRINGQWVALMDGERKSRARSNGGYGNENLNGLNELNRGPRSTRSRSKMSSGSDPTIGVSGLDLPLNGNVEDLSLLKDKDLYNRADFVENYTDAKFFIIKSYCEDDIHKSIKYNVWSSTPSGNKKLNAAYQKAEEKLGNCPVFLFFSVNTSGQFVGLAKMVGPVDFNKNMEYWQQDKWNGCFPVKWHIVKDVPNNLLRHIILEYNDNKPVTNSRDTQEVKLEQGLQMLKLFKDHICKSSILDDFSFYDIRQKAIQDRRAKHQHLQKEVQNGRFVHADEKDKDNTNEKPRLLRPLELVTLASKECSLSGFEEQNPLTENGAAAAVDANGC